ncbi:MAG TPA: YkvA family protein [Blastocatellia bacterium]|nr:YkvA family protein [Blastocatellia bacterium]
MTKRGKMKARMRDLLLFVPNLLMLLFRLLRDPRVSSADKAIVAGTIIYVIAPIDIIPDFIPFIGQVDDSYLIAISILRLLNRADGAVIREHWRGERDIKELVTNIARVAEYFLPKRLRNVLRGRIEPKAKIEEARQVARAVNE